MSVDDTFREAASCGLPGKTLPAIGNLVIEQRADSVVMRLHTDHDGAARFTYGEIERLAEHLLTLRPKPRNVGAFE